MQSDKVSAFHASGNASISAKHKLKRSEKAGKKSDLKKLDSDKKAERDTGVKDKVDISGKKETGQPGAPQKKKWTVLAYVNGKDSNLSRLAPSVLRELEVAGSDENLNIVAQLSRKKSVIDRFTKDWSGTRRYYVNRNKDPRPLQEEMMNWFIPPYTQNIVSPVKEDLGDKVDSGDVKTLKDFLKWGIKKYPAEHYCILLYGQGGGFAGSLADDDTGNVIDNKELSDAIKTASKEAGKKIDVVAFDGNLMSQLEVADQMKDSADILVASEGSVQLGSLPLDGVMKDLKFELADSGKVTPEQLAKFFVFEQKYQPGPAAELLAPTLSAVDLEKVGAVKKAFNELAKELATAVKVKPELKEALREDLKKTQAFVPEGAQEPYGDYRDIGHFAKIIKQDERFNNYYFPQMEKKADNLINAVKGSMIDEAHIGQAVKNATGMSAYMPTDFGYDMPPSFWQPENWDPTHGYGETTVSQDTVWDDVLAAIAKDTRFHSALRKLGLGDNVINKIDKIGAAGKKTAMWALGFAKNAGYYEAYQAARGKQPGSYFKIPGDAAAKIGVAGGAYGTYKGGKQAIDAALDKKLKNRKVAIIDGVADSVSGAAVAAACIGMSFAKAASIAQPAGIVSVAVPIAKMVYDVYTQFKQQAAAKAEMQAQAVTPKEKLKKLDQDKLKAEIEQGRTYISPIVRWLYSASSSGPVDARMLDKD